VRKKTKIPNLRGFYLLKQKKKSFCEKIRTLLFIGQKSQTENSNPIIRRCYITGSAIGKFYARSNKNKCFILNRKIIENYVLKVP